MRGCRLPLPSRNLRNSSGRQGRFPYGPQTEFLCLRPYGREALAGFSHKVAERAPQSEGLSRIPAVLKSIPVAFWRAGGFPTV